jgi:small-conductance mechanosensitive channel
LDVLLQLLAIAVSVVLSHHLSKAASNIPDHGSTLIKKLKDNTVISFYELCFYTFTLTIIGIEQSILNGLSLGTWFVTAFMIFIAIFTLIRSSFVLAAHSSQARFLVLGLWLIILFAFFGTGSSTFDFLRSASISIGTFNINLLFIIEGVITFTILLWVVQFLSVLLDKEITSSKTLSPSYKVLYLKLSNAALYSLATIVGLTTLGFDLTVLTVFSGALGLGLGIGLQRIFANFIAGIILLIDKSIKPGDLLQIEGSRGIVDYMNARYVSVVTFDGQNILVPNEAMMNDKVHNLSFENTHVQLHQFFLVPFGTDLGLTKSLVDNILKSNKDIIQESPSSCLIAEFTDCAVKFEIKYWIDAATAHVSHITHNILFSVWEDFKANGIELYTYEYDPRGKKSNKENESIDSKSRVTKADPSE